MSSLPADARELLQADRTRVTLGKTLMGVGIVAVLIGVAQLAAIAACDRPFTGDMRVGCPASLGSSGVGFAGWFGFTAVLPGAILIGSGLRGYQLYQHADKQGLMPHLVDPSQARRHIGSAGRTTIAGAVMLGAGLFTFSAGLGMFLSEKSAGLALPSLFLLSIGGALLLPGAITFGVGLHHYWNFRKALMGGSPSTPLAPSRMQLAPYAAPDGGGLVFAGRF